MNIADSSLDENKPYVLGRIKDGNGADERLMRGIYVKIGIFCRGTASMNVHKTARLDDSDIKFITEVFEKLIR